MTPPSMNLDEFRATLGDAAPPPGADLALQGLWWAGRVAWDRAHDCVQQDEGNPDCDAVHAYLHRQEGDGENAAYWYRRAGRPIATGPLEQEWAALAEQMLARTHDESIGAHPS